MQVLLNEITAYIRLVRLWSKHVPRLLYWGTTCNGSVLVLATELLTGASLAQHYQSVRKPWKMPWLRSALCTPLACCTATSAPKM